MCIRDSSDTVQVSVNQPLTVSVEGQLDCVTAGQSGYSDYLDVYVAEGDGEKVNYYDYMQGNSDAELEVSLSPEGSGMTAVSYTHLDPWRRSLLWHRWRPLDPGDPSARSFPLPGSSTPEYRVAVDKAADRTAEGRKAGKNTLGAGRKRFETSEKHWKSPYCNLRNCIDSCFEQPPVVVGIRVPVSYTHLDVYKRQPHSKV